MPMSDFNPRSRMGSDVSSIKTLIEVNEFQSTLPHGERLVCECGLEFDDEISIHAPAWGATCVPVTVSSGSVNISIHAPAWGATL